LLRAAPILGSLAKQNQAFLFSVLRSRADGTDSFLNDMTVWPSTKRTILRAISWFFEIALVFVRLDHFASIIVNANHGIV
jgi:hypothetical protein